MSIYTKTIKKSRGCAQCGKDFLAFSERNYCCSKECFDANLSAERKRKRMESAVKIPDRPCLHCGEIYSPKKEVSRFCSNKCACRYRYARNPYNPETYKTGRTANKGRSQDLEHVSKRMESTKRTLLSIEKKCVHCGESYTPTLPAQKYCSGRCWNSVSRKKRNSWSKETRIRLHPDHYAELLRLQDGKCAICGSAGGSNGRGDKLAVDHCHESGRIRGLLCHRCNTAIGLLKDDVMTLHSAIEYLTLADRRINVEIING